MCEQKFSIIILNDNKISIPRQFRKIGSLSPFIFNKLLNDPFTYVIKSSISQNTLNSFLAYLCEDAELKISIDNYFELMQISDEFQLQDLKNLLLEKKRIWEYYERILENLENKQNAFEIMQKGLEQKQKDFWPVGSIYQTFNDEFDPNLNWEGKWIKVEGKFILGSSNLHKINSVGGEETHKLTINEMPSHSHDYNFKSTSKSGNDTGTVMSFRENYCGDRTGQTTREGANEPHNNMPPYRVAHIWERIE